VYKLKNFLIKKALILFIINIFLQIYCLLLFVKLNNWNLYSKKIILFNWYGKLFYYKEKRKIRDKNF